MGGGRDNVGVIKGAQHLPGGDEARDVRHIHQEEGAHLKVRRQYAYDGDRGEGASVRGKCENTCMVLWGLMGENV